MGYISEVLIRIKHTDTEAFTAIQVDLFLQQLPWVKTIKEEFMSNPDCIWTNSEIRIYGSEYKWYENFPDVSAANEMWDYFKNLAETDEGLDGCYIRIGEDAEDIQEDFFNSGDELGHTERAIFWEN